MPRDDTNCDNHQEDAKPEKTHCGTRNVIAHRLPATMFVAARDLLKIPVGEALLFR
jgi:hypothetical protein